MSPKLAAFAFAVVLLSACGDAQPAVGPRPTPTPTLARVTTSADRTLLDMTGRAVSLPARASRVVALSPAAVDFVVALGLEPAGRPSDSTNPAAASAPAVGSTIAPDFQAIADLKPDLVVADAAYHGARRRDFDQFPFPVFIIKVASYDEVLAAFRSLGDALARPAEAESAVSAIERRAAAVASRVAGAPSPSALLLTGSGREVYAGSTATYAGGLLAKLGAANVMGEAPQGAPIAGFGLVELSQVAVKNPDVVLTISSGEGGLAAQVLASPAWAGKAAVTSGRVHELDASLFLRSPGPRVAEAVEELARLLYPGR